VPDLAALIRIPPVKRIRLAECLEEVTHGVGQEWSRCRVLGATRAGLAPAKEQVGGNPQRYKLVGPKTIFYNPMRILLGSIAVVEEGEPPGITSPDYVVFRTRPGLLHYRWFYYWLRSADGAAFIRTLSRGAVRERMLFRRLAAFAHRMPAVGRARGAAVA
jgi:type I restriction enzyme, S subunit